MASKGLLQMLDLHNLMIIHQKNSNMLEKPMIEEQDFHRLAVPLNQQKGILRH
jgi:hypothetical protein